MGGRKWTPCVGLVLLQSPRYLLEKAEEVGRWRGFCVDTLSAVFLFPDLW